MSGDVLQVQNLNVSYRRVPVLHGVDLPDILPGSLVALVGPNGAGKSTLLRALAGLLDASGHVQLGKLDLLKCGRVQRSRKVGFMPQTLPEGVALSVLETLLGALRGGDPAMASIGAREQQARAFEVLEQLGILDLALRPLERLSGGQRQMVSLAQAVIRDPALLLLDEPTSALDLRHQDDVMSMVHRLSREGRTVVVVLHDLGLAARWADQIVVIQRGRLHGAGPAAQILTAQMLAEVYRVRARVERCSQGRLLIAVDGALAEGEA
ncbi:MAG: transporter ATP-binding protein [Pseudomonas sp.]|nr:transporter ATP-binding protein [Pseudomonas sp.]